MPKQPQDEWMLAEEVPHADVILVYPAFNCLVQEIKKIIKIGYSQVLGFQKGRKLTYYFGRKESYTLAISALDFIHRDPKFGLAVDDKILKYADDLINLSEKSSCQDPKKLSNLQLAKIISDWNRIFQKLYAYGWIPNLIDTWYPEFTQKLKSYLRCKTESEDQVNRLFVILTTASGRTEINQEFFDLLRVTSKVKADKNTKELFSKPKPPKLTDLSTRWQKVIQSHNQKYSHLEYLEIRKAIPTGRHLGFIHQIIHQKIDPQKRIKEILAQERLVKQKKHNALKKYAIDAKYRQLFNLFGRFMLSKTKRKLALARNMMLIEPIFKEMAKRLKITRSLLNEMSPVEIADALRGKSRVSKSVLEKRRKAYVYYGNSKGCEFIINKTRIKKYQQLIKEDLPDQNVSKISGQPAFPGKVKGVVKKLNSRDDVQKVKKGDILVAQTTDPDMVPAMRRAAAVITDMGGVTSHAAIVARELKVPCIIGTKFAMKVLKDGDRVDVDAEKGIVKKL